MDEPIGDEELTGLLDLIVAYGAACRREGSGMAVGRATPPELTAAVDRLRKRVVRRVRRLELLAAMGGIEPSDVRGALVGVWRN